MYLRSLTLLHFKNFIEADLNFSPRVNCFVGNNGVGKTTLLDAIHYLCLCKSYFHPIDSQNIRHDQEFAFIQGVFSDNDQDDEVMCSIHHNKNKIFKRNKKEYERLAQHIGLFPVVMISPEDSVLVMEGSDERRKFMNSVIAQYNKEYLDHILRYNKLLAQRNKVLKDPELLRSGDDILEVYDLQMIPLARNIHQQRVEFTEKMIPIFQHYYRNIAPEHEQVNLEYQSQLLSDDFEVLLRSNREKDRIMQYSTCGIHKDDLILRLNGHPLKRTGSQGQQKTFLVALKLAQYDFMCHKNRALPILLLDDVFDKFDESRVRQIIHLVSEEHFGQIFISHTDTQKMHGILGDMAVDFRLFHLDREGVTTI
jgi:DNA replication and repair protein RecF